MGSFNMNLHIQFPNNMIGIEPDNKIYSASQRMV